MALVQRRYEADFEAQVEDRKLSWKDQDLRSQELQTDTSIKITTLQHMTSYEPAKRSKMQVMGMDGDKAEIHVDHGDAEFPEDMVGWEESLAPSYKDFFYFQHDLGELHMAVGIPFYVQFVVQVTGSGSYRFGEERDVLVEVDAGDAVKQLVTAFQARLVNQFEYWLGIVAFGTAEKLPTLKGKKLRVSMHYDFGVVKSGDTLHFAWHSVWTQYKTTWLQTLGFTDTYQSLDPSLLSAIHSVRLRGRPEAFPASSKEMAEEEWEDLAV